MSKIIKNYTPHAICLNSGEVYQPEAGQTPIRVSEKYTYVKTIDGIKMYTVDSNGAEVTGLPEEDPNVDIIVSRMVFDALPNREDVLCPLSGSPECIRWKEGDIDDHGNAIAAGDRRIGQVRSVPGFLRH